MESSPAADNNIRKRVCKACDRCRLKKSKCDGSSPCSRCKADNAICVFGERKKSHDKVYPKGYVEMLEQQQSQLVAGLREMYTRMQKGESWPGSPLQEAQGGHPLTHDILERLGLLHASSDGSEGFDHFEDDTEVMQQKLAKNGTADRVRRRSSISSESEHGHISPSSSADSPPTKSQRYNEPSVRHAPLTPPSGSPYTHSLQLNMAKIQMPQTSMFQPSPLSRSVMDESQMAFSNPMFFDNQFSGSQMYNEPLDYDGFSFGSTNPSFPVWPDQPMFDDFTGNTLLSNPMQS